MLDSSQANLEFLFDYCERDLRRQLPEEFGPEKAGLGFYADHGWSLFEQFNFDERGVTLNFSPYNILPYVFGSQEVSIPWVALRDRIAKEFRSTAAAALF